MSDTTDTLFSRYFDGVASASEVERLNTCLESDSEARTRFAEIANLDSALGELAAGWELQESQGARTLAFPIVTGWMALAAALALLLGGAFWWHSTRPFAVVAGGAGADDFDRGTHLRHAEQVIAAGSVELRTRNGALVVIEAPARFQFESAQRLRLFSGRLAADVPLSAKGFTVVTADGEAIDLGTRFGVDVPASGNSEIHVFEGEVVARDLRGGTGLSLRTGEALSWNDGEGAGRELRTAAFIQPDEVDALSAGLAAGQRARSSEAADWIRNDYSLIALIDFESTRHPGIYRVVQGRWPGSKAPEFVREGDHMELDIGGDRSYPQLTLAAWVRLDRLGDPYQSLFHTDGWSRDNPGQVHWMINQNATMRLALQGNTLAPGSSERHGYPDSKKPVLPEQGRWVHLATVYDSNAGTVRFYLNGAFDSESRQAIAHPARLGSARIGNWDKHDRKLSGRIDQFVLIGRSLSDKEIQYLFETGNPYR